MYFLLKVFAYSTLVAHAHIRIFSCESLSSTSLIQPHSPRNRPVLDKAAVKNWEKPVKKKCI